MPQQKLTIVPVTLHAENKHAFSSTSLKTPSPCVCTIKMANASLQWVGTMPEKVSAKKKKREKSI